MTIGFNRYPTSGAPDKHPGPFKDNAIGFAMAHNGNLPLTDRLDKFLERYNISTGQYNDSEKMGLTVAQFLRQGQELPDAIDMAFHYFRGSYSCVAMHDGMVVAFRDPKGIRPLALGSFDGGIAVASETCGLDIIDANYDREVEPGEMVIITKDGVESKRFADSDEEKLDMFEFVYFARQDSVLYGQRLNEVRRRFGQQLAKEHPPATDDQANVLVVPIPDTSIPAAEAYAQALGLEERSAIIKNRFIGRTFMADNDRLRNRQLRRKHSIIDEDVRGRDIVFIDDSIVRGNTMPRLVRLATEVGAKSVSVLIASSPVRFPDFYGIDTPEQSELMAANLTVEQMRQKIGCKYLGFLSLDGMVSATGIDYEKFNLSCFNGEYPIGIGALKAQIKKPISMEFAE